MDRKIKRQNEKSYTDDENLRNAMNGWMDARSIGENVKLNQSNQSFIFDYEFERKERINE